MAENQKRRRGCLLKLVVVGLLVWGGCWMWNNRRDQVLDWKSRAESWLSSRTSSSMRSSSTDWRVPDGEPTPTRPQDNAAIREMSPVPTIAPTPRRTGSDPAWKKADNWTRAKADNIDDLTEEDISVIEAWDDHKPRYARMLADMRQKLATVTSVPAYSYNQENLKRLRASMEVVAHCVEIGDPLRAADQLPTLQSANRAFWADVRWRPGVPHPTAPHVHSGQRSDNWEPDDGYVFASNRDGDLSVIYRGHAYRCQRCNGTGIVTTMVTCPKCQGQGRVPNPAIQGANALAAGAEILNAFSKHPKQMNIHPMNDPGIVCGTCNGHRQIKQTESCPSCEGGTVWR